ncbi:hypothetical protein A2716_00830 [candidate division WWE3 bacterium RIFCSPHIGHO2_01_FULL_40_23]|uniref:NGG1p interacting factor NIF3 n=1 Tax=candidate division WWE3 bacterium RIFCSPLOWO2_01_FULL_41_18 TaxID=1802625 RepID=A0A1F4VEG8_UNCKA|nr:MAG: hypothetical protein A2716_00830 [candidate division WWE3 bacterium RIFCSPHIGHO2_01_FULL_40_23]OGC55535.1 MAG: hypothetical protein A3A78_01100 [candidate division WWE3 bacterium RIFCSPLOWO2_01_FULL_41_18]
MNQEGELVKLVVFVPQTHADRVREAIGNSGAGKIGNYSHCSFSVKGEGRYKPLEGSHPAIGKVGGLVLVEEERIETVCEKDKLEAVMRAVREVHPYEEVAFDVYPMLSF